MGEREISAPFGVQDAISLFWRLGIDVTGMAPEAVKTARRELLNQHHPDRGGDLKTAQLINAAYDLLKNGVPQGTFYGADLDLYEAHKARNPSYPEWAWAGFSGGVPDHHIYRNDFSDVNFIKKSMWELSGHSSTEYTIWGFDGCLLSGNVTVFGSPKIFHYMATAMITWLGKHSKSGVCRAVLVSKGNSRNVDLIYGDAKYYCDQPITLQHQSFNLNPGNDRDFATRLLLILEEKRSEDDHTP
jgi:hypothetical protein